MNQTNKQIHEQVNKRIVALQTQLKKKQIKSFAHPIREVIFLHKPDVVPNCPPYQPSGSIHATKLSFAQMHSFFL